MVSKYTGNPDVERARQQTVEEWLEEYTTGIKVTPGSLKNPAVQAKSEREASNPTLQYKYVGHRTSYLGRVILVFECLETGKEVYSFFNVDIEGKHKRGEKKNKRVRTGDHGEFYPKKRSNFRKFWMNTIGREPRSWSRAHLELHARLKNLTFKGEIEEAFDAKGIPYNKLLNPRLSE